ncbi:MAG TPA: ribbon-helix-helix protein, CopG family [Candidatus Methylomirabilis sp.]|nr:ribbon-helix-helix protein, CopG family [Candidatus Methylomirabilis sp.]
MSYNDVKPENRMGTLTIRLDDKLEEELTRLAKRTGRRKSDLAREALRKQLAIQRFRALRRRAMPYAEAAGYLTDEDVFRDVS